MDYRDSFIRYDVVMPEPKTHLPQPYLSDSPDYDKYNKLGKLKIYIIKAIIRLIDWLLIVINNMIYSQCEDNKQ
jgi:hypothetical protein